MYVFYVWYQILYPRCGHHTYMYTSGGGGVSSDVGHGRTRQSVAKDGGRRTWREVVGGAVGMYRYGEEKMYVVFAKNKKVKSVHVNVKHQV